MFENAEISLEHLPQADAVEWQALDERFVRRLQVSGLLTAAALALGVCVLQVVAALAGSRLPVVAAWLIPALALLAGLCWPPVSVARKGYAVRDKDIVYRSGVFLRSVTAIPFNRVQHVETSSTPLDRHYRLATLQLYTAGSAGGDLKIDGLPAGVAERLRVFVLGRAGAVVERD
jgi:membrane protein YdbS with pleckstrin-like domain